MISIEQLKPARLTDLQSGSLFIDGSNGTAFVAGKVGDFEVLCRLSGENPFSFSKPQNWSARRGSIIDGIRFEVSPQDGKARTSGAEPAQGELIRYADGFGLGGHDQHFADIVALQGEPNFETEPKHFVGFMRWQITVMIGDERTVLFDFGG